MPCLIYVSIIKNKWLMRGRRTYPAEGGSRAYAVAVDNAVLGCLGWRTMGCWRAAGV